MIALVAINSARILVKDLDTLNSTPPTPDESIDNIFKLISSNVVEN